MSDPKDLIVKVANGDSEAFRLLYDLFSSKVYNTAISYVQNAQDADEVSQDVFVSVFKNAKKFKGNSSVGTWIYRITINTSINHINGRKKNLTTDNDRALNEKPDFEHPGVILENKEKAQHLFAAIEKLGENQKTAFILSFIEDLPRQKVADIMEMSLKGVESLLQRAKQNLRLELKKMFPNRRKLKK